MYIRNIKLIKKLLLITLVIPSLYACDSAFSFFISNKAKYHIECYCADGIELATIYPDTTLLENANNSGEGNPRIIEPNGKSRYDRIMYGGWFDFFEDYLRYDTVSIYFFHRDTLLNNTWETIRKEYKVLQRYDLSRSDMNKLDTILFPPNDSMRFMKMYPPYGTYNDDGSLKEK